MSQLWLNRLIIETSSPMAINSGGRETGFDTELARDANGLPYIPATAIAGVWRHLARARLGDELVKRWFGALGDNETGSRLYIQHGLLLNSQGKVMLGLQSQSNIEQDELLKLLQQSRPHHRERVRINDRGVADHQGKFDQIMLPRGTRFCLDIRWQGEPELEQEWQQLLECLNDPAFALGASTRNGLGRFNIVADKCQTLALANNPDAGQELQRFMLRQQLPTQRQTSLSQPKPFARLGLTALDGWRCGKGSRPFSDKADAHVDSFTYSEPFISWHNGKAQWSTQPQAVLCGSSIKGILAHRLAYHYRRHSQQYAEQLAEANNEQWTQRPTELRELLGDAADQSGEVSLAGRLIVEDTLIKQPRPLLRTHNSIDRFTGGVRHGVLYSEELLWQPHFELVLQLQPNTRLSPQLKNALQDTLDDLKQGLLPMGAGSGRGNSLVEWKQGQPWEIDWSQIQTKEEQA